jgi:hypothetical protein
MSKPLPTGRPCTVLVQGRQANVKSMTNDQMSKYFSFEI